MSPTEVVPGLISWTAPHPAWKPDAPAGSSGDWEQMVRSVLYEQPDRVVLIDPLLPTEERESFLDWLDRRVDSRAVSILTTIRWHRRDREELAERYRENGDSAWNMVPRGVTPKPLRGARETLYWLPAVRTLVAGDSLIGAQDGLRVCPESWLEDAQIDRRGLATLLRLALELPIERLLVSHGEPVLHDGRAALAHAIGEAEG